MLLIAELGSVMMIKLAWGQDSVSNTGDLTSSPDSSLSFTWNFLPSKSAVTF